MALEPRVADPRSCNCTKCLFCLLTCIFDRYVSNLPGLNKLSKRPSLVFASSLLKVTLTETVNYKVVSFLSVIIISAKFALGVAQKESLNLAQALLTSAVDRSKRVFKFGTSFVNFSRRSLKKSL